MGTLITPASPQFIAGQCLHRSEALELTKQGRWRYSGFGESISQCSKRTAIYMPFDQIGEAIQACLECGRGRAK